MAGRAASWSVHGEGYLDCVETSVFCYHDTYPVGKQGGIEIIHHGERVATNGYLRVELHDGRDAGYAQLVDRTVDADAASVEVTAGFSQPAFRHRVRVEAAKDGVRLSVSLDAPLADYGVARAWFELLWFPPLYWGKTFSADGRTGVFPREIVQEVRRISEHVRDIVPMAEGREIAISPDDPDVGVRIRSLGGPLVLRDERFRYEGEWFAVRSDVPVDRSGEVLAWIVAPAAVAGWRKQPMIAVSQVGYHPDQRKRAVIELDPRSSACPRAYLERLHPQRGWAAVHSARPRLWGPWLRYRYAAFDFSAVRDEGVYRIRCGGSVAGPFRIARGLFRSAWEPTLTEYFPVQMCHMEVWNGGRFWHAACHMDDAMQVPSPLDYIDGYRQSAEPDTPYRPFQHIPHLDRGGWHDAGDTDLAAGSQIATTYVLGLCREEFVVDLDQTTVLRRKNLVRMREPDGVPDIVEQIEHGVESVLGGYRAVGHSFCGIIESIPQKYFQRGEVSAMTDNRIYDPALAEGEVDGNRSGLKDDRYAFTNRDSGLEYGAAAALALSSRLLRGHNEELAAECRDTALAAWRYETTHEPVRRQTTYVPHDLAEARVRAAVELYLATGDRSFLDALSGWAEEVAKAADRTGWVLSRVWDRIADERLREAVLAELKAFSSRFRAARDANPFGISWEPEIWGVAWQLQELAVRIYYLGKAWPDLFDRQFVADVMHWALGCHPGNNVSMVSGVGTRSLTEAFGINRADWSYIAGGNASGVALLRPDFPELKTGFPWLWQQSEYVMAGAATWIFTVLAAERLAGGA